MKKVLYLLLALCLVGGLVVSAQSSGGREEPLRFVIAAPVNSASAEQAMEDIAAWIFTMTGLYVEPEIVSSSDALVETFAQADGDVFGLPTLDEYFAIETHVGGNVTPTLASNADRQLVFGPNCASEVVEAVTDAVLAQYADEDYKRPWVADGFVEWCGAVVRIDQSYYDHFLEMKSQYNWEDMSLWVEQLQDDPPILMTGGEPVLGTWHVIKPSQRRCRNRQIYTASDTDGDFKLSPGDLIEVIDVESGKSRLAVVLEFYYDYELRKVVIRYRYIVD